jgi:hypothetical protein
MALPHHMHLRGRGGPPLSEPIEILSMLIHPIKRRGRERIGFWIGLPGIRRRHGLQTTDPFPMDTIPCRETVSRSSGLVSEYESD